MPLMLLPRFPCPETFTVWSVVLGVLELGKYSPQFSFSTLESLYSDCGPCIPKLVVLDPSVHLYT